MTFLHVSRLANPFPMVGFISLFLSFMIAGSVYSSVENPSVAIAWLFQPPPDSAKAELRLTSMDPENRRFLSTIKINYLRRQEIRLLTVAIIQRGQPEASFCFQSNKLGDYEPCGMQGFSRPESKYANIPGTMLPWYVLIERFFLQVELSKKEITGDGRYDVFELVPAGQFSRNPAFKLRVYVARETNLSEKMSHVNNLGREIYSMDIHEIHRTGHGLMVVSSTYRDPETGVRVLIETRSVAADKNNETQR